MWKRGTIFALAAVAVFSTAIFASAPKPVRPMVAETAWEVAPAPLRTVVPEPDPQELHCLALNVYFEARGESVLGQKAVAHVTLNRVADADYPKTVCGVVQQGGTQPGCQFHWYCDAAPNEPKERGAWTRAKRIARQALLHPEEDPTGGALLFHVTSVNPQWSMARGAQRRVIGTHVFVRPAGKARLQLAENR